MDISAMLKLKEKGMSNRAIAKTLGVDKKTVNKYWNQYKSNFEKLETTNNSTKIIEMSLDTQKQIDEYILARQEEKYIKNFEIRYKKQARKDLAINKSNSSKFHWEEEK